jgi:hypothetical protein
MMRATGDSPGGECNLSTICRIPETGGHWRVLVETWPEADGVRGRFVFEPEGRANKPNRRAGGATLRAQRREELVAAAHELPERRLRELLNSLR